MVCENCRPKNWPYFYWVALDDAWQVVAVGPTEIAARRRGIAAGVRFPAVYHATAYAAMKRGE
jgi:hypothetical protein